MFGKFSGETTDMCYRKNPDVGLFSLHGLFLLFLFYTGLLPSPFQRNAPAEILPMLRFLPISKYLLKESTVVRQVAAVVADGVRLLVDEPGVVQAPQRRGISTYLWV